MMTQNNLPILGKLLSVDWFLWVLVVFHVDQICTPQPACVSIL